jgi:hypothetical protein
MNNFDLGIQGLHLCFGLVLLLVLNYFWCSYRVDVYRQMLFDIRDELFDIAREYLNFEDSDYRALRQQLNAEIRFAHKTNLLRLIALIGLVPKYSDCFHEYRSLWERLIGKIENPDVRERLQAMRERASQLTADRIFSTSMPPLYILLKLSVYFRGTAIASSDALEVQAAQVDDVESRLAPTHSEVAAA